MLDNYEDHLVTHGQGDSITSDRYQREDLTIIYNIVNKDAPRCIVATALQKVDDTFVNPPTALSVACKIAVDTTLTTLY